MNGEWGMGREGSVKFHVGLWHGRTNAIRSHLLLFTGDAYDRVTIDTRRSRFEIGTFSSALLKQREREKGRRENRSREREESRASE